MGKAKGQSKYSVPDSCCKKVSAGCGKYPYGNDQTKKEKWLKTKINKSGCHYYFFKEVKYDIGIGQIAGVLLFILELLCVALACSLLKKKSTHLDIIKFYVKLLNCMIANKSNKYTFIG